MVLSYSFLLLQFEHIGQCWGDNEHGAYNGAAIDPKSQLSFISHLASFKSAKLCRNEKYPNLAGEAVSHPA